MGAGESSSKPDLILKGVWKAVGTETNLKDDSWVSPTYLFDFDYRDETAEKPERTFRLWKSGFEDFVSYGCISRIGKDVEERRNTPYTEDAEDPEERRINAVLLWKLVTEKNKTYYFKASVTSEFREDTATMRGVYGTRPDFTGPAPISGTFTYDFWRVSPLSKEEIEERRRDAEEKEAKLVEEKPDEGDDGFKDKKKKKPNGAKNSVKGQQGMSFGSRVSIAVKALLDMFVARLFVFAGYLAALCWPTYVMTGTFPTMKALKMKIDLFGVPAAFVLHLMSGWVSSLQQALTALFVGQDKKEDCQNIEEPWWFNGAHALSFMLRAAAYAMVGWAVGEVCAQGPEVSMSISVPVASLLRSRTGLPPVTMVLIGLTIAFDLLKMSAFGVRARHNGSWGTDGVCSICRLMEPLSSLLSTLFFVGASGALLFYVKVNLLNSLSCILAVLVAATHFTVELISYISRDTSLIENNISYVRYASETKKLFFFFF